MAAPFVVVGPAEISVSGSPSGSTALVSRLEMGTVSDELADRVNIAGYAMGAGFPMGLFQKPPCMAHAPPLSVPASGCPLVPVKAQPPPVLAPPPPSTVLHMMLAFRVANERVAPWLAA